MVMDSGSPAINFFNIHSSLPLREKINSLDNVQDKLCELRGNIYENSGCLICINSIINVNRTCILHCPYGSKNGLNDICSECLEPNCEEFDSTKWILEPIDQDNWRIRPN